MRRTYMSPEYRNDNVYGTYNMSEESNFFASKMLDIEDIIYIENQDIIFYQKQNGEQLDFSIESSLSSYVYSSSTDKLSNHNLVKDESQPIYQIDRDTKWIMEIDLTTILSNYLYSILKKYRVFEGVKNEMTAVNDVNISIKDYITKNILNRYKFKNIDLYINYTDLRNQNLLRFKNTWNPNTIKTKFVKSQTETAFDDSKIKLIFNQEKPSSNYNFEYYFNILFEKL